ncbi:unnamed protein product [Symbiodinium microadriaticum]|nr:unnamed protein product [Symbiodinium sp. KB8]CAE7229229.1 unnamed protein product [Symbiodinium microadriaticum]
MASTHVTDFTKELGDLVEERAAMIQNYVDEGRAASRDELAKYVWSTGKKIYKLISPTKTSPKRKAAWENAKGMLKEIIDFDLFHPETFHSPCVKHVLEPKILEVLKNYHYFVLTGMVRTRHFPPKLLGETDELLCVDKPVNFTCGYGGNANSALPRVFGAKTPTQLLNSSKETVQIHEYLALKFDYETALGTRDFWAEVLQKDLKIQPCTCGKCAMCACMQAGCCNRLDKETSGVMVAAKTKKGFPEIRKQFQSEHSLEEGGTEKYYFALVRGHVQIPAKLADPTQDWKHGPADSREHGRRGRIEIAMRFDQGQWRAVAYNDGNPNPEPKGKGKEFKQNGHGKGSADGEEGREPGEIQGKRLHAVTFYNPVAWFTNKEQEQFTLLHLQIVTGRTHQIRFHVSAIGYPIVGDCTYGAPQSDRDWAKRVFLHSYETRFREPFTNRWFEATSPLPQDLGQLLCDLQLERTKDGCPLFLSRRQHTGLKLIFKQYEASTKLLLSRDAPANASKILEAEAHEFQDKNNRQASQAGHQTWGSSSGYRQETDHWKTSWSSRWSHSTPWNDKWSQPKEEEAESDDDAWGKWKAPKEPPKEQTQVQEPEAKRPRLAEQSGQPPAASAAHDKVRLAWKRKESTRQAGVFYYINMVTNETQVEPPEPWVRQQSRRDPSVFFYWTAAGMQMSDDTGPREPVLRHMDWTRAMGNHQREEQLRAFLAEYPADLRRKVCDMEQALLSKDFNRLQEAAQQVMGSSSFVAATQLHDLAMELEEAIDLETGSIPDKTARVVQEARELEQELVGAGFVPQEQPVSKGGGKQACCVLA